MTRVNAWLEGHPFDLSALARMWANRDVRVVHDEDAVAYYLTAPEIDNAPEPNRFDLPAVQLMSRINGLARSNDAGFRPVSISGRFNDDNGGAFIFVPRARAEARMGTPNRYA